MTEKRLGDEVYELDYFEAEGFERRTCSGCGDTFWTRDEDRTTCGEPPCGDYEFIGSTNLSEAFSIEAVREEFLSFFEANGHERVSPYPVAANRWRDDVLLTQASIYDFQPLVTSGETPPPANPLCVSQPCIRMNDIENVGRTGRHTTAFEMLGHHAFNARDGAEAAYEGEQYWKEETVAYCDAFFEHMGADLDDVVYIEDPWTGGGNAGPAFEVIYRGLELATLVFMSFEQDDDGAYRMKDGNTYSKMDTYVVDTGYGLERWAWVAQGTPTVYEAVYPDLIDRLKQDIGLDYTSDEADIIRAASLRAGRLDTDADADVETAREAIADDIGVSVEQLRELIEPLEQIYAVADHTRALAYMLGDEIVPSSNGTGYLTRRIFRRTRRFLDELDASLDVGDLITLQADRLGYENVDFIGRVARSEAERFEETQRRGREHVRTLVERYSDTGTIPTDETTELYESYGLRPETVEELVRDIDETITVEKPETTAAATEEDDESEDATPDGSQYDDTTLLFYEDVSQMRFEATVERVVPYGERMAIVLDRTAFYPEGGGQPADTGDLKTDEETVNVTDVQKHDGTVFHVVEEDALRVRGGDTVQGVVNEQRRRAHMRHHTATHIIGDAAREVLGNHIKQTGTQKRTTSARLDVTHYETPTQADIDEIEAYANTVVQANHAVGEDWVPRREAEDKYGFDIYQGGIPSGETLRLITVGDDVQACAGTHVQRTGDIGTITITDVTTVQDGVVRLTLSAGDAALDHIQTQRRLLADSAGVFDVPPEKLPSTSKRFFSEWKEQRSRIEELQDEVSQLRVETADPSFTLDGTPVIVQTVSAESEELVPMANAIAERGQIAVLVTASTSVSVVVRAPSNSSLNAGSAAEAIAERVGGSGGGDKTFGQGGGPDVDAVDSVLDEMEGLLQNNTEE